MNEILQRMRERLNALNEKISRAQKYAIGVVIVLLAATIGALVYLGTRVEYGVLYSELKQEDAGKIADRLRDEKVDFKLDRNGTTILVPVEKADELRLMIASEGGPVDANPGYKLFDKADIFGMPEEVIQVNKRRIMEGELAKSIESIEEVKSARVHLAVPPEELFVEDQKAATASVILNLRPGAVLRPKQVKGIVNIVAGAVPNLSPDNVTIVNQNGKILRAATDDNLMEGASGLEYQRNIERELEQKATDVLEKAVGRGKAIVRVRAKLDFSQEQRTEEIFDPQQQIARSEETLSEQRQNGADQVGGVAGAAANDPNVAQGVVRVGDASNSNREKTTVNYEIGKITKKILGPDVRLTRLSVAVLVDGVYKDVVPAEGGDPVPPEYSSRTKEEIEAIKNLVAKAVELDGKRGDEIEVANLQFQDETAAEELVMKAGQRQVLVDNLIKYGLILLVFMLLVFAVFRPVVRWLTAPSEPPPAAEVVEEGALPEAEPAALPGIQAIALLEQQEVDMEAEKKRLEELSLIEKIREFANQNPDVAASVVRYWLKLRMQA